MYHGVSHKSLNSFLLYKIWAKVLGISQINKDDNFFKLGGHSLTAISMFSQLKKSLNISVPLLLLFSYPVLGEFVSVVQRQKQVIDTHILPSHLTLGPASFGQQRLWFLQQFDPDSSAYNIPEMVQLTGKIDVARLKDAACALVAKHEVLRTTYTQTGKILQQCVQSNLKSNEVFEHIHTDPASILKLASNLANTPFNLSTGPVIRFYLLSSSEESHVFMFVVHHIASDGWSNYIIWKEITSIYNYVNLSLATNQLQYIDYSMWQRQMLRFFFLFNL